MLDKPRNLSLSIIRLINSIKYEHSCNIFFTVNQEIFVRILFLRVAIEDIFGTLKIFH